MPGLSFGLKSAASTNSASNTKKSTQFSLTNSNAPSSSSTSKPTFLPSTRPAPTGAKRKNLFDAEDDDGTESVQPSAQNPETDVFSTLTSDPSSPRAAKSPKLSSTSSPTKPKPSSSSQKYTSLSALRNAKLHDAQASQLDESVYDYDGVYDSFQATSKNNQTDKSKNVETGPKYMTSLLTSASVRKRDQLRAQEKKVARDREKEGDEFADKEAFVTGAYKKQQEENLKLEEDEARREAEEEERKRRGEAGMMGWNRKVLEREEERMKAVEEVVERLQREKQAVGSEILPSGGAAEGDSPHHTDQPPTQTQDESKEAAALNLRGARVALNDEGEVVDKRQLLSAGLNVAKKPPKSSLSTSTAKSADVANAEADAARRQRDQENYGSGSRARDAKQEQRERQTRMIAEQLAAAEEAGRLKEEAEQKERVEKSASGRTEEEKMGARERFLKRKAEREREKAGG